MKIYVATTNPGKLKEILFGLSFIDVEAIPLKVEFDEFEQSLIDSGVNSMVEISKAKARFALKYIKESGLEVAPVMVDDSGIFIDRLGKNVPGINSKKFSIDNGGVEGMKKIIVEGEPAYFQNVISITSEDLAEPESFIGRIDGKLSKKDTSPLEPGFPFNHLFIGNGTNKFFCELSVEERNGFNHRLKAVALAGEFLIKHYKIQNKSK